MVALMPLVLLGLLALAMQAHGLLRYDPAYFSEPYVERYGTPDSVASALERALQTADGALLAELQGLRSPRAFETNRLIDFVRMSERTDRYITYLYVDLQTYDRYPHHVEWVDGRWVVSPVDVYYLMQSGRWQRVFLPAALAWWFLGSLLLVWRRIRRG